MNLLKNGNSILGFEITSITKHGIWFLLDNKEYFIPFKEYPQLKRLSIQDILKVRFSPPDHIYWENYDIDIEISALENPKKFKLVYKE